MYGKWKKATKWKLTEEWKKIFANCTFDKSLTFKMYFLKTSLNSLTEKYKQPSFKNVPFFQVRHVNGQQVLEKMLNISNHQRNVKHNHKTSKLWCCLLPRRQEITNTGKDVEDETMHYCGDVNWYSYYGKQYGVSLKTKNKTTISFTKLTLSIYLREMRNIFLSAKKLKDAYSLEGKLWPN